MEEDKLDEVPYFLMEKVMRSARHFTMKQFAAAGVNLTVEQWVVLKQIYENRGVSQKIIADTVYKDAPTVTRIIDQLCKKGLVIRVPDPTDRRKFSLIPTAEGKKLHDELMPLILELREKGIEGLSRAEVESLKKSLRVMYQNLK